MTKKKYVEDPFHEDKRRKFSHTSNPNLMHDRISQEIGFISNSDIFRKIVQGYYNVPPDIDDYTTAYLKYIRRALDIIKPPQATVTTKYYQ